MNEPVLPERINPAGMARMLGMSRARLYQLLKDGAFPAPCRDAEGRPFFDREQQVQIVTAYRMNVGVNGQSVFFRPKAIRSMPHRGRSNDRPSSADYNSALLAALRAMGVHQVTKRIVEDALRTLFPAGLPADKSLILRKLFLHLHGGTPPDSQER